MPARRRFRGRSRGAHPHSAFRNGVQGTDVPLFDFNPENTGGVDALDPVLKINGTSVTPTFRYKGGDATSSSFPAWGYGEDLPIVSVSTEPTYNDGSPLMGGTNDDSVGFNASDYYKTTTSPTFGTDDMVWEFVVGVDSSGRFAGTRTAAATEYVDLQFNTTDEFRFRAAGSVAVNVDSAALPKDGSFFHGIIFYDASGSAQWYVNGSASGSAVAVSGVGDVDNSNGFSLGAYTDGTDPFDGRLAYLAVWKSPAWLDTHLQATVAAERFAKLTGVYETRRGTVPSTATRATTATVVRKHEVNYATYTEDLSNGAWTKNQVTAGTTSVTDPFGGTCTTCAITENTATATHFVEQDAAPGLGPVTISVYLKEASRSLARIQNASIGNSWAEIDLSDGTLRATGAGSDSTSIEDVGDGWYRFSNTFTNTSTGTDAYRILISESAGVTSYEGNGLDAVYSFGFQIERGTSASPYEPQTTGADILGYRLYTVGAGWMRTSEPPWASAPGFHSELAGTNLATYSEDLSNAAWTKTRTTASATSVTGPDGQAHTTITIAEDGTAASTHLITQNIDTGNATVTFSGFFKAANRSWIFMGNVSGTSQGSYFDLSTGAVGTEIGSPDAAVIYDYGNGWYRCAVTVTGVTGGEVYQINVAEADNDTNFSGLSQDSIYAFGIQVEASPLATSYVKTTSASATRNKDVLIYTYSTPSSGSISGEFTSSGFNGTSTLFSAYTDINNRIYYIANSAQYAGVNGGVTQWNFFGNSYTAGTRREMVLSYGLNDIQGYEDGSSVGTDTSATIPSPTIFGIGSYTSNNQYSGLIHRIRTYHRKRVLP